MTEKNQKFKAILDLNKEILSKLQEYYPGAFPKKGCKLLKIGIHNDIKEEGKLILSSKKMWSFFSWYCSRIMYLKLVTEGQSRYNLQGLEEGKVTKEQAEKAESSLGRKIKKVEKLKIKEERKKDNNI